MPVSDLSQAACYAAFRAHDSRFDGRVFIGVSSTGVYCRPICRVKTPKEENCAFFPSAAAAEAAGFRPCLKCRPELAPGLSLMDARSRLAGRAALLMEENGEAGPGELAKSLGVTGRHLRRVFQAEYGVSPVAYRQTSKLLLAKKLLTDSSLSITDAAFAAGFGSIRRFNDLFKKHYRLTPGDLRKARGRETPDGGAAGVTLLLGYRPPYQWEKILDFLSGRAVPGVESVAGGVYRRTVRLSTGPESFPGWICVEHAPEKNALALTLAQGLLPVLPQLMARVKALFDLDCDPLRIHEKLSAMPVPHSPGTRLPGAFDPFEMCVRAILGQQITVKAARTLAARFALAFGGPLETPFPDLALIFPAPARIRGLGGVIEEHLGPLGITGARARSILALAVALDNGELNFGRTADPEREMENLGGLPGFGPWTVQYVAMRALNWPDAFPHTDHGVKKALGGLPPGEILKLAENWRPWRSYATINLWNSLADRPKEKT